MAGGSVDERGFAMVRRIRSANDGMPRLPPPEFKALIRDQFLMLLIDQEASLAAIPAMLPARPQVRDSALALVKQVLSARGELVDGEAITRLRRVETLFGANGEGMPVLEGVPLVNEGSESRIAS